MEKKELCGDGSVKGCSHPRTKILLYGNQGDGGSWTVHTLILTKVLLFRNFSIRLTEKHEISNIPLYKCTCNARPTTDQCDDDDDDR